MRRPHPPGLAAPIVLALVILGAPAGAAGQSTSGCLDDRSPLPPPRAGAPPLRLGVYPGGLAGQVGRDPVAPKPESEARITAAVERLRPSRGTFTLHYYRALRTAAEQVREERLMRRRLERWGALGLQVDYAITYRKHDAADEFARFVRGIVRRHGGHPALHSLQITNEVNVFLNPDASDGSFRGAREALVKGVIAADRERRRRGHKHLQLGFNWFYNLGSGNEDGFWSHLRDHGGRPFIRALDWIGLDVYPGSFSPTPADLGEGAVQGLRAARCYARFAGFPDRVPIHIQELGWGTDLAGRTPARQARNLERMLRALNAQRGTYNLSNVNWFSLRDSNSSAASFQEQWGLMRDDYSPKPAFGALERLVERWSARARPGLRVRAAFGGSSGLAVTGRLVLPAGVAPASGCRGRVVVAAGARAVAGRWLRVGIDCGFRGRVRVSSSGRAGALRVTAHFAGNRALRPAQVRALSQAGH